jgi:hypothetical protein
LFASAVWAALACAERVGVPRTGSRLADGLARVSPVVCLPLVLAVGVLWAQPAVMAPRSGPVACAGEGRLRICLDAEVKDLLPLLEDSAGEAVDRFGPGLFDPAVYVESVTAFDRQPRRELAANYSTTAARLVAGVGACGDETERAARDRPDLLPPGAAVSMLIASEVANRLADDDAPIIYAGDPAQAEGAVRAVTAMSDGHVKAWIADHQDQLATCSASLEDLAE